MNYDFLFDFEIPPGVKSIFIKGKKISREEFIEYQNKLRKKKLKTES
jgi:hypothetical protein